jgi:hypothetical protein
VFLLVSEFSLFRAYFARNWPLLSPSHGFVTLALAMIVLGVNMLGNLNKPATSQESLGLAFWRIVIGSGIVIFILGFVNLVAVSDSDTAVLQVLANTEVELRLPRSKARHHRPSGARTRRCCRPPDADARQRYAVRTRTRSILHPEPNLSKQDRQPIQFLLSRAPTINPTIIPQQLDGVIASERANITIQQVLTHHKLHQEEGLLLHGS